MVKVISIGIIIIISVQAFLPVLVTLEFYQHRTYYYEQFCINRDKPITICGGQCHLNQMLKDVSSTAQQDTFISSFQAYIPDLFFTAIDGNTMKPSFQISSIAISSFVHLFFTQTHLKSIFRPPKK